MVLVTAMLFLQERLVKQVVQEVAQVALPAVIPLLAVQELLGKGFQALMDLFQVAVEVAVEEQVRLALLVLRMVVKVVMDLP